VKEEEPVKIHLSPHDAFRASAKLFRRRAVRLWILVNLYFPIKSRKYFYLCYTYLRWVDNYVDNPTNSKQSKKEFIEKQLELIECLSNCQTDYRFLMNRLTYMEEIFIYYFIEYAGRINNCRLISEVKREIESILMDAERLLRDGIYSNKEFDEYIELASKPLFNIVYYFLFPNAETLSRQKSIGNFIGYIATYRDFFDDIKAGYINIGREDLLKYNLDVTNLQYDKNLTRWMGDKLPRLFSLMYEEISILKTMQLKLKLFWIGPYLVVLDLLIRIKVYDCRFGIKLKKDPIKELRIFIQSFVFNIKLLSRVF
jgi:hypothetical protein